MFNEAFPILSTPDLTRALAFYRDLLGLTETYRFPSEGEPAYVGLRLGSSELGIGADRSLADGPATFQRFDLCVYADDCDAAVERLRDNGVRVLEEPVDQPWGERMARVSDPDGNRVIILARTDGPAPGNGVLESSSGQERRTDVLPDP